MTETITITRAEYDRLCSIAETASDIEAVRRYLQDPRPGLSHALTRRLIDGEHPLKLWREARAMSQSALAEASGVNRVQIGDIEERGKDGSIATLKKLAQALDLTIDEITL